MKIMPLLANPLPALEKRFYSPLTFTSNTLPQFLHCNEPPANQDGLPNRQDV